jgi:Xaa-Pro aminopeptidase
MFEGAFQSFHENADPSQCKPRIAALRRELAARKLDGFIIPRADEHQSEYTPPNAERLAWLTGFTGSAGLAIVLRDRAAIFVDGRYTLQVKDQVDTKVITPVAIAETTPSQWLAKNLKKGAKLAYDPWLLTPAQRDLYARAAEQAGAKLAAVPSNPVDAIWMDRPAKPANPIHVHPLRYAGVSAADKRKAVIARLGDCSAMLISDPHDLAWLFNLRGSDVAHTPIALCFAILRARGKSTLFVDAARLDPELQKSLRAIVDIHKPVALMAELRKLSRGKTKILCDAASVPSALVDAIEGAGGIAVTSPSPIRALKAIKNTAELKGTRAAHIRDGAAMVRFLCWFDERAAGGKLTEIDAVRALESFRRETGKLREISFPTISGAGPNGAIVHYRVTEKTNRRIGKGLFLLDSGAQYQDGTTDITRTIAVGAPSREMKDRFTRVLKGHIGIARAVFPKHTKGQHIDAFARMPLWEAGLDYDHGTGHGVGSFLSVHEGPQGISKASAVDLEPGMICSNEPGFYKTNAYGIRIENLVVVEKRQLDGGERPMFGFETITLAPIDLRCVDTSIMTRDELKWLDAYHARVRKTLSPLLDAKERKWLAQATRPLARQ